MIHRLTLIAALATLGCASNAQAALLSFAQMNLRNDALPVLRAPAAKSAARAEPKADGNYEVTVLVMYNDDYATTREPGVSPQADVQRMIDESNGYFAVSGIPVTYRLVATARYTGAQDLQDYTNTPDLFRADEPTKALRNSVQADLVVLMMASDALGQAGGRASLFNNGERSDPPANVDAEHDAYAVIAMGPARGGYRADSTLFAHELGHNLGGGHNIGGTLPSTPYWKPYAYATVCTLGDGKRYMSIMHTGAELSVPPGNVNINFSDPLQGRYFSNPQLDPDVGCGNDTIAGTPGTGADNARSITEAAPYVAAYRGGAQSAAKGEPYVTGSYGGAMALWMLLGMAGIGLRRRARR